jgi:transposase-like protein
VSADQLIWATAKQVLGLADSTDEPADLSREERRQLGERLISHGWSYREISSALDVPTTTLHRWLAEDTDVGPSAEPSRVVPWIVAAVVSAALVAIFRKGRPM